MLLHFKKVTVSLNGSHSVNYIVIPIFFKIIVLSDVIPDPFLKYLYFFL